MRRLTVSEAMQSKMKDIISESRILRFLKDFNRIVLSIFFGSQTCALFAKARLIFKDAFLKNADKSAILGFFRKAAAGITTRDIGIFIVLLVIFNTLIMLGAGMTVDVFSAAARLIFLILGIFMAGWEKIISTGKHGRRKKKD